MRKLLPVRLDLAPDGSYILNASLTDGKHTIQIRAQASALDAPVALGAADAPQAVFNALWRGTIEHLRDDLRVMPDRDYQVPPFSHADLSYLVDRSRGDPAPAEIEL